MRLALILVLSGCVAPGDFDRFDPAGEDAGLRDAGDDAGGDAGDDAGRDAGRSCVPSEEICDGIDNDCDPATQDGQAQIGDPCDGDDADLCLDDGVAQCAFGTAVCPAGDDDVEICNGADDDCDGTIDDEAGCPCVLAHHDGHAYLFCAHQTSWNNALDQCPDGYALAKIDDAEENAFVLANGMTVLLTVDWWIGASDQAVEGTFVWVADGSTVGGAGTSGYQNWAPGQPDGSANCVEMEINGSLSPAGTWSDDACGLNHPSVCESLGPTTSP